jgi:hypothetical protein
MAKHDPKAHAKKAQKAYNEITSVKAINLKDIVQNSRQLVGAKASANVKNGIKVSKQAEKLAKEQVNLDAAKIKQAEKENLAEAKELAFAKAAQEKAEKAFKIQQANIEAQKKDAAKPKGITPDSYAGSFLECKKALDRVDALLLDSSNWSSFSKQVLTDIESDIRLAAAGTQMFSDRASNARKAYQKRVKDAEALFRKVRTQIVKAIEHKEKQEKLSEEKLAANANFSKAEYIRARASATGSAADKKEAADLLKSAKADVKSANRGSLSRWLNGSRDENGTLSMAGIAKKTARMLGSSAAEAGSNWWHSTKLNPQNSVAGRQAVESGAYKSMVWVVENAAKAAQFFGGLGKDSFLWIAKKIGGISGMLLRYLKKPFNMGSGGMGLSDLIGLGALIPTLIGPILSGLNDFLDKTYGENWFKDLMSNLWQTSWSFIKETVAGWLGLESEADKKNRQDYSDSQNKLEDINSSLAGANRRGDIHDISSALANRDKVASQQAEQYKNLGPTGAGKAGMDSLPVKSGLSTRSSQSLQLDALTSRYDHSRPINWFTLSSSTDEEVQKLIDNAPPGSIDQSAANRFNALNRNVKIPAYLIKGMPTMATTPNIGRSPISVPADVNPYSASKPVSVPSAPSVPSVQKAPAPATPSSGSNRGLSNATVPNRAQNDAFSIISSGILAGP